MSVYNDIKYMKTKINQQINPSVGNISFPKRLEDVYASVYMFTNENIKEYISAAKIEPGQKVLSVLASGDHIFNLLHQGVLNIDTFDINKFTEYYALGIKRTMLEKYDYNTFLKTYEKIKDGYSGYKEFAEIISDLIPNMESKHRKFWKNILNYYYKHQTFQNGKSFNLFANFLVGWMDDADRMDGNIYLTNSETYKKAQTALSKSNITFKSADAINLSKTFNQKYDYLFLSNILDYVYPKFGYKWEIDKLNEYITSLEQLMNDKGIIFLHYCFPKFPKRPIFNAHINFDELSEFEILNFRDIERAINEAMILKRIKKEDINDTSNF